MTKFNVFAGDDFICEVEAETAAAAIRIAAKGILTAVEIVSDDDNTKSQRYADGRRSVIDGRCRL